MDIWVMWEVYRDEYVKAYKQFESAPSPIMRITLKVIVLISLSLFMYYVSVRSFMHKEFFDGACYAVVALSALILSAIESEPQNKK